LKAEKYDISCYFISTSGYRPPLFDILLTLT